MMNKRRNFADLGWKLSRKFFFAMLGCLLCSQVGCGAIHYLDGTGIPEYGYVLRIGNAEQITQWGLQQSDAYKIDDAVNGLGGYFALHRDDCDKREAAVGGIVRIYSKLIAGWPGYKEVSRNGDENAKGPLSPERRQKDLERHIELLYGQLLDLGQVQLYLALQPEPEKFPERYRNWWDQGKMYRLSEIKDYPVPKVPPPDWMEPYVQDIK